jgi:hypothetical protein
MRHADRLEAGGKRMIRRLFTITSAISTLILLAAVTMWVRGIQRDFQIDWAFRNQDGWLDSAPGGLRLGAVQLHTAVPVAGDSEPGWIHVSEKRWCGLEENALKLPGLKVCRGNRDRGTLIMGGLAPIHFWGDRFWDIQVQWWALALLASVLPAGWIRFIWLRRARAREGCCAHCGYDLRASKGRCPECGTLTDATPNAWT